MRTSADIRTLKRELLQVVYWIEGLGFLIKKKKIWLLFYNNSQGVKREKKKLRKLILF